MRDTERRLAGDVLAEALDGELDPSGAARAGCGPSASAPRPRCSSSRSTTRTAAERGARARAGRRGRPAPGRDRAAAGGLLCAVVDGRAGDPLELAAQARDALRGRRTARCAPPPAAPRRVGVAAARLPRGALRARGAALRRTATRPTSPPAATSAPSSSCSRSRTTRRCELYCDSVLGPLENGEGEYGGELLRSLEAFLEHNGQWERAARELYCHRHTLRYRIRRVEQLTGRDLASARDRIEFWLALRAQGAGRISERSCRARRRRHDRPGDRARPGRVGRGRRAAAARPRRRARRSASPPRTAAGKATRRGASTPRDASLAAALDGCDVLVNAASYRVNLDAMRACLEAGCHYLDLGGLYRVTGRQLELDDEFERAGLLALLGIGSSPGKTNVMARARGARAGAGAAATPVRRDAPPGATSTRRRRLSRSPTRCRR